MRILTVGRRFLALPRGQRQLLVLALIVVANVRVALCVLPSRLIVRLMRRLTHVAAGASRSRGPSAERVAWAVSSASRVVPRATCLTQAISGQLLLRHYGHAAKLCLGVARSEPGRFLAHAWLERDGRVLLGGAESVTFTRLPSFSAAFSESTSMEAR